MAVYNGIIKALVTNDVNCVDIVQSTSKVIEVDADMRARISTDEVTMKYAVFHYYLHEGEEEGRFNYAKPVTVGTFKALRDKDNKVKDMAMHIVMKMYEIWCQRNPDAHCSNSPNYRYPIGSKWSLVSECCKEGQCRIKPGERLN